ncbi:hypothetical protein MJK71_09685 [Escherichia coli]|nr:hypothetical protein MJK71_09685 [Escherichia coli]
MLIRIFSLLDEPTNNLDIDTIRWLGQIAERAGGQHHDHHLARPSLP